MDSARESAKFMAFLGVTLIVIALQELFDLDWFYAGFFVGIVSGGLLFQPFVPRRERESDA